MKINKIYVQNFKSFKELEIELKDLNILLGQNSSGKSNFIQIFKFLADISRYNLDDAISLQGGVDLLKNFNCAESDTLVIRVNSAGEGAMILDRKEGDSTSTQLVEIVESDYEFGLSFKNKSYQIRKDLLKVKFRYAGVEPSEDASFYEATIVKKASSIEISPSAFNFPAFIKRIKPQSDSLLLEPRSPNFILQHPLSFLSQLSSFDFDPKLPKRAAFITGKNELQEDASNLSIVLKKISRDKVEKTKFLRYMRYLLPFVSNIDISSHDDRSIYFKLQEKYSQKASIPASSLSDGTINLASLVIALFFDPSPLVFIEEPERNLHPSLIAKVVELIKTASKKKQIVITTHNPEIVRYSSLDNILLIKRDSSGSSRITLPSMNTNISAFLDNDIGLGELFVNNLLD
jgi:predicted ATPase